MGAKLPLLELTLKFAPQFRQQSDPQELAKHRAALPRHAVTRWIRHALARNAQITVLIVGREQGCELNRDYRSKNYATNVLTFGYESDPKILADLVLCAPVVEHEAQELGVSLTAHYAHLLVHGTLHAQGWDHEKSLSQANAMEAREIEILHKLGFTNPYA
jgi:probable rRNA maturation factor